MAGDSFLKESAAGLRLISNETTPGGLAVHVYELAGLPRYGTNEPGA
jgi:hypothetical protein